MPVESVYVNDVAAGKLGGPPSNSTASNDAPPPAMGVASSDVPPPGSGTVSSDVPPTSPSAPSGENAATPLNGTITQEGKVTGTSLIQNVKSILYSGTQSKEGGEEDEKEPVSFTDREANAFKKIARNMFKTR